MVMFLKHFLTSRNDSGANGTRTRDLFVANEPRYHLRYSPRRQQTTTSLFSEPPMGLEPMTFRLQGGCSTAELQRRTDDIV